MRRFGTSARQTKYGFVPRWNCFVAARAKKQFRGTTRILSNACRIHAGGRLPAAGLLNPTPGLKSISLNEIAAFLDATVGWAPRHDRHGRCRVLRRTFDQLIGINHVDQCIALRIATANNLHFLEEKRAALAEHVVALLQLFLEMNRTDLPAGQRNIRNLLGNPQPPLDPSLFGNGEMAGYAFDLRIIDTIGCKLVIGTKPFEHSRAAEDQIWFVRGNCRRG